MEDMVGKKETMVELAVVVGASSTRESPSCVHLYKLGVNCRRLCFGNVVLHNLTASSTLHIPLCVSILPSMKAHLPIYL